MAFGLLEGVVDRHRERGVGLPGQAVHSLCHATKEKLQRFLDSIDKVMEANFELKIISLIMQVQVGIALYPKHDSTGEQLLQMAGTALQHAQQNSQPRRFYDPSLSRTTIERLHLISGFKSAIDENQLVLFYQPKM